MARAATAETKPRRRAADSAVLGDEPLWYKDAIIYELHVRAFSDSNGDGVGDFKGLTQKLDYLRDLGITAIWLLPFFPSPLRDDGYDIADYTGVNPAYGTRRDVRRFVEEAHKRGIRVIIELVINHTSDQHAWFQRARRAPRGSAHRDFYVWSDDPTKYGETRIIFQDFETSNWTWDPVAAQYYWHRFYHHQPDLNFDNPAVQEAVLGVMEKWFETGVDGMRLDAVPYLFEREGTNCENLPETHGFLRKLRAQLDRRYRDKVFLAEANQWPEDAISYFGAGDECHMCFHFPLMPRLFMSVRMEDRFPVIDILEQTPEIPGNCQWAIFLRNHDELTLEMVTDEERDYMYRVYANDRQARINLGIRRRLAPLLENNRRKIELMNGLLFSLPGTPVLYYGDEIGMGDNIYLGDRDSVRTPMQWSGDRNAGFSNANPQKLFLPVILDPGYHYETVNVESQQQNPSSLLWWMKRLIGLRRRHPVFARGEIEFLHPENPKVLAYIREHEGERVLVVANLSRFTQAVELDLSELREHVPVEMFGHTRFPAIGDLPYFLTLGPHGFYWFLLEPPRDPATGPDGYTPPAFETTQEPRRWLAGDASARALGSLLPAFLPSRRWFGGKARTIRDVTVSERVPLNMAEPAEQEATAALALVDVDFTEGESERYALPLVLATAERAVRLFGERSPWTLANVTRKSGERYVLYDGLADPDLASGLLESIIRRRSQRGRVGRLAATATQDLRRLLAGDDSDLTPHLPRAEQSNTSIVFGDKLIFKLFRRVEAGRNPDLEIGRHLTETVRFTHTPPLAGALEFAGEGEPLTIAMLQGFVPNEGDAWKFTLAQVGRFFEAVAHVPPEEAPSPPGVPALVLAESEPPEDVRLRMEDYLYHAELLGERTAEMHAALADDRGDSAFEPERFTQLYQRGLYQTFRNSARRSIHLLRRSVRRLEGEPREAGEAVLERESEVMERMRRVSTKKAGGLRIRCHGDYHLGQVLWTGKDFIIIDFEGEPARPLGERKLKRSPLSDVAGMIRSFQYAAATGQREQIERGVVQPGREAGDGLEAWSRYWQSWASAAFLRRYLATIEASGKPLLPAERAGVATLLDAWLLEKALYEVRYELNNRPGWVSIPLRGILELLEWEA